MGLPGGIESDEVARCRLVGAGTSSCVGCAPWCLRELAPSCWSPECCGAETEGPAVVASALRICRGPFRLDGVVAAECSGTSPRCRQSFATHVGSSVHLGWVVLWVRWIG